MNHDDLIEILAAFCLGLAFACFAVSIVLLTTGPP